MEMVHVDGKMEGNIFSSITNGEFLGAENRSTNYLVTTRPSAFRF